MRNVALPKFRNHGEGQIGNGHKENRMRSVGVLIFVIMASAIAACGTTDSAMRDAGQSEAYVQGFHDGRHSGMREAGNRYEHFIKDAERFSSDVEYRSGWLAGEEEGKRLQANAVAVGNAAAGAYEAAEIQKEVDKQTDFDGIAEDAVKGVDPADLENLQKQ